MKIKPTIGCIIIILIWVWNIYELSQKPLWVVGAFILLLIGMVGLLALLNWLFKEDNN